MQVGNVVALKGWGVLCVYEGVVLAVFLEFKYAVFPGAKPQFGSCFNHGGKAVRNKEVTENRVILIEAFFVYLGESSLGPYPDVSVSIGMNEGYVIVGNGMLSSGGVVGNIVLVQLLLYIKRKHLWWSGPATLLSEYCRNSVKTDWPSSKSVIR